ncbi:hypothetical protein GGI11_004850 [Coemansia sp. RSA 2049]|nr:hypothetical protein GGI11_004850 [Coemansia sp. RSA 2049]KAJ2520983.1 hypothetical protein H4217_001691 [Coemansia sp. RSA 1939]KAJ2611527.1 hypothetical protein EV177_003444 [Coemansia sp. RSA 1804]KAJ2683110.1 hypothetical protein GGH99_004481 [Coemansia sp. RSA 1285]
MDQDTARLLFEQGACLVVLDAPTGIEFGIDMETWETGPLFSGLKMIPPGIHYIHYRAMDNRECGNGGSSNRGEGRMGMQCGFFHDFAQGEVVVRRWDPQTEQLVVVTTPPAVSREEWLRSLDPRLGAYPVDGAVGSGGYERWKRLTSHVTPALLSCILPSLEGCFSSATGSVYEDEEMEAARKRLAKEYKKNNASGSGSGSEGVGGGPFMEHISTVDDNDRFGFTAIDVRHSFPKNAEPAMITRYSVDKTWLLRSLLHSLWNDDAGQLLGELQISFLVILVGQNFSGLEHWKRLMHVVLGSSSALEDPGLVETVVAPALGILRCQLDECPAEFVTLVLEQDSDGHDGFVATLLSAFVLNLYECPQENARLEASVDGLRRFLRDRFSWLLPTGKELQEEADLEDGEYAPQIVDPSEIT